MLHYIVLVASSPSLTSCEYFLPHNDWVQYSCNDLYMFNYDGKLGDSPANLLINQGGYGHTTRALPGVSLPSGSRTRNLQTLDPAFKPLRCSRDVIILYHIMYHYYNIILFISCVYPNRLSRRGGETGGRDRDGGQGAAEGGRGREA
jgi:hypothetical protein